MVTLERCLWMKSAWNPWGITYYVYIYNIYRSGEILGNTYEIKICKWCVFHILYIYYIYILYIYYIYTIYIYIYIYNIHVYIYIYIYMWYLFLDCNSQAQFLGVALPAGKMCNGQSAKVPPRGLTYGGVLSDGTPSYHPRTIVTMKVYGWEKTWKTGLFGVDIF